MIDYKIIAEAKNFIVFDKYTREWQVAEGYQSEADLELELIQEKYSNVFNYPDIITRRTKKADRIAFNRGLCSRDEARLAAA